MESARSWRSHAWGCRLNKWLLLAAVWLGIASAAMSGAFGAELAGAAPNPAAEQEYQQGRAFFDKGKFADAASRFERALALAPGASLYAQWLGRACGLQARDANLFARPGLANRSRAAMEKAVALDPNNLGARSDLAAYYAAAPGFMGGGMAKAQAQVAEIRKRDPYMGQVRAGDLLLDEDKTADAEKAYLAAVRLDGQRPDAHGRLAYLYQQNGRHALAFAQCDALLQIDPAQPNALYGLGKTAALSGQRTKEGEAALRLFLQGAKSGHGEGSSPARAHYYLGMLAAGRGDRTAARVEYEAALRIDPNLDEPRKALGASGK